MFLLKLVAVVIKAFEKNTKDAINIEIMTRDSISSRSVNALRSGNWCIPYFTI
jgi:hypothetical protein